MRYTKSFRCVGLNNDNVYTASVLGSDMSKSTPDPTGNELENLILEKISEPKGLDFLLKIMNDTKSRVTFKIEIEVTRVPEK